jgi:hypothetical protein
MAGRESMQTSVLQLLRLIFASFIYNLYQDSKLPWVYGGEYPHFSDLIIETVEAWIRLGLKIYFVFDGQRFKVVAPTVH